MPTQSHATAKGRGNYSWTFSKKSFTLKLDKKVDLCGMGKSKKWALISGAYDKSLLRTSAAFNIGSKLTNMAWTPSVKPVDLYINGSYRGSYLLSERITVDENLRFRRLAGLPDPTPPADPNDHDGETFVYDPITRSGAYVGIDWANVTGAASQAS